MNHSMYSADQMTHLKIVAIALVTAIGVAGFAITTRIKTGDGATRDVWRRAASPLNVATGVPSNNAIPVSDQAIASERFTRTGPDALTYELSYTDPPVFTAPWTARLTWTRDEGYQMYEYACHEGNVSIRNNIMTSRAARRQAAASK